MHLEEIIMHIDQVRPNAKVTKKNNAKNIIHLTIEKICGIKTIQRIAIYIRAVLILENFIYTTKYEQSSLRKIVSCGNNCLSNVITWSGEHAWNRNPRSLQQTLFYRPIFT